MIALRASFTMTSLNTKRHAMRQVQDNRTTTRCWIFGFNYIPGRCDRHRSDWRRFGLIRTQTSNAANSSGTAFRAAAALIAS